MTPLKQYALSASILLLCSGSLVACGSQTNTSEKASTHTPAVAASKTNSQFNMTVSGSDRCFTANGLPDHPTGEFPNRGNPNAIAEQDVQVCVPITPTRNGVITPIRGTMGIAVNGVQFRPNTAGYYDPNGRRGHSPNGDKNWSLDIHGAPGKLGLDFNNAHVGAGGLYHYHGIAENLLTSSGSSLIGYAGDGYEIHYVGETAQSGWALKSGTRPSGPGGSYDGTYNEDYEFVGNESGLDDCNGGQLQGQYVYFVTDSYPFVSRCLSGVVSADFNKANHRAERGQNGQQGQGQRGQGQRGQGRRGQGN